MSDLENVIAQLLRIIKSENTQLRQGKLTRLEETIAVKQTLVVELTTILSELSDNGLKKRVSKELDYLQALLKENDTLMKSAIRSVKTAHKQISAIRNTEKKVGAYNRFGKTVYMSDGPGLKTKLI
jgi:hypothetical protein